MLKIKKHAFRHGSRLSDHEIAVLKNAYGRFAKPDGRSAGTDLTNQLRQSGYWVACDCVQDDGRPPLLFPIFGGGLRREERGHGVEHADTCAFFRDSESQNRLVLSYRKADKTNGLLRVRLAPPFESGRRETLADIAYTSKNRNRPGLARLLCELLVAAELDIIKEDEGPVWDLFAQKDALRKVAARVEIGMGITLDKWLALSLAELDSLKERVARYPTDWGRTRPHGLFISTFGRIEGRLLYPERSDIPPVPVEGTLSIFGEGDAGVRAPYLVVGLVSKPMRTSSETSIVRAYAHPCVDWNRFTLVDSGLERDTLKQIIRCKNWLRRNFDISVQVTKPLFDVGPTVEETSREICLPDFIVRARGSEIANETVVVETMGYSSESYRNRKERMRELFEAVDRGSTGVRSPVIEYDPFEITSQPELDDDFWQRLRWAITQRRSV